MFRSAARIGEPTSFGRPFVTTRGVLPEPRCGTHARTHVHGQAPALNNVESGKVLRLVVSAQPPPPPPCAGFPSKARAGTWELEHSQPRYGRRTIRQGHECRSCVLCEGLPYPLKTRQTLKQDGQKPHVLYRYKRIGIPMALGGPSGKEHALRSETFRARNGTSIVARGRVLRSRHDTCYDRGGIPFVGCFCFRNDGEP